MVQTHIADAIDGGFNIFHCLPGQLTVGDNRQLLVKFIIEQEKSFNCCRSTAIRCW